MAEMQAAIIGCGVLDVVAADTFTFRHQTFQEYLAASALATRFLDGNPTGQQLAWEKHTFSRWQEIERLLVGILVQEHGAKGVRAAVDWLGRLLGQQSAPEGDVAHLSLELAARLLAEVAGLPAWQSTRQTAALEEQLAA